MGQEAGEKWTAEAVSQPTIPKPDRLLELPFMAATAQSGNQALWTCGQKMHSIQRKPAARQGGPVLT